MNLKQSTAQVIKVSLAVLVVLTALFLVAWPRRREMLHKEPFEDMTIPDLVWQTYKTVELPPKAKECQNTWKTHFATSTYALYDDAKIEAFMRKHFDPKVVAVFLRFPLGVMRADMWRYAALYIHGGIYSDIDSQALQPRAGWNIRAEDKVIIGVENDVHFCQWTLASVPRHPLYKAVLDAIVSTAEEGIDVSNEHFVHKHTGPGIWTRAIHEFLGYPIEQKAQHTFHLYQTTDRLRFQKWGIRLEDRTFFSRKVVKNLYGSTQFSDGYVSWMEQRDALRR